MKLWLKGHHFYTNGEIHADSQEVMETHIQEPPGMHEIMGNMLGLLYTHPKGLLQRRQWKLGVAVRNFFYGQIPQSFR
jgi:hypothetical protein